LGFFIRGFTIDCSVNFPASDHGRVKKQDSPGVQNMVTATEKKEAVIRVEEGGSPSRGK